MKTQILTLSTLVVALILAACHSTPPAGTPAPAGQHAIHSENLRQVMWGLALAQTDRLPQELDAHREQKWRRSDAIRILGNIAESAGRIPDVLQESNLPRSQQTEFRKLAGNLRSSARQLQKEIPGLKAEAIGNRFQKLMQNCTACHDRFRSLPPLPDDH